LSKVYHKTHISLISMVLFASLINLTLASSYPVGVYPSVKLNHLSPQTGVFKSLVSDVINEKTMFEAVILDRYARDSEMNFTRGEAVSCTGNLFANLRLEESREARKTIEVFFKGAVKLGDIVSHLGENNFIVPGQIDGKSYFAVVVCSSDGAVVSSTVYSEKEFDNYCDRLVIHNDVTTKEVTALRERLAEAFANDDKKISFVEISDEAVRASVSFLEKLGAVNMSKTLRKKAEEKKIVLMAQPSLIEGSIVVAEVRDEKLRAESILRVVLNENDVSAEMVSAAFEAFWGLWQAGKEDDFNAADFITEDFKLLVSALDAEASNEGGINLSKEAYELVIGDRGIKPEEWEETVRDIRDIFKKIAEHDMPANFKPVYELYCQMEEAVKGEDFERAAQLRNEINKRANEDHIDYLARIKSMPGIDPGKIIIEEISECHVPTDVVTGDGTVRINDKFVKLMYWLKRKKLDEVSLTDYFTNVESTLYTSILYSLAIHTLRGHLPVDSLGEIKFNKNEEKAQGERGRRHLYLNVLAMMFYWIMFLERESDPAYRARFYMTAYPGLFSGLTAKEKEILPDHIYTIAKNLNDHGVWQQRLPARKSGATKEKVDEIIASKYPGAVYNEGGISHSAKTSAIFNTSADIFRMLSEKDRTMTIFSIASKLKTDDLVTVGRCLDILKEIGVVSELSVAFDTIETAAYKAETISSKQKDEIFNLIRYAGDEADLMDLKGEILELTEGKWAHALRHDLRGPGRAELAKAEEGEIIVAVETDSWVPGTQKGYIQALVQDLEKLNKEKSVRVIRGTKDELAVKLQKAIDEGKVPLKNVVVLANEETLASDDYFKAMMEMDASEEKPFLAGVNAKDLGEDSYIRLLEMISMAMRMAFGQRTISDHSAVEVRHLNDRYVIFTPKADPVNFERLKEIYDIQRDILTKA